jgi:abequosyltransferase
VTKEPYLLSICIPSYNRPEQLGQLLASIDAQPGELEIVIGEDVAPKQAEVRERVAAYSQHSPYPVVYYENERNLGYDGNLRGLVAHAQGEFVLFMGDDDWFAPGKLDAYLAFLRDHRDVGYVLRNYYSQHPSGELEEFKYLPATRQLEPGLATCTFLFKRTVSICGVTFKRERALAYATDQFDGTLLYQLYLVAEIALREPTIYCEIPVAIQAQTYRLDRPQFGAAAAEKGVFQPGRITFQHSIHFTKGYFRITEYIDQKYGLNLTALVRRDLSKYSYPFLSIQRKRGRRAFGDYAIQLARETKLNQTWHYYFYSAALWLLGETWCDRGIVWLKRRMGHTPQL